MLNTFNINLACGRTIKKHGVPLAAKAATAPHAESSMRCGLIHSVMCGGAWSL